MSVYTDVSDYEICLFLSHYDLGDFISLKGIAQGITNSNYFLTTSTGVYVLTIFEVLKQEELPFFLHLKLHLSNQGVACPAPIIRLDGNLDSTLMGKPACLVSCLKGQDIELATANQCFNTGKMLAKMHLAGLDFPLKMENPRGSAWWTDACNQLLPLLSYDDAILLQSEINNIEQHKGGNLPSGIIHADLFKDNVLMNDDEVAGFIDFYYACNGLFVFDLAIAINDWARTLSNTLNPVLVDAFILGYEHVRPLTKEEIAYFPIAQRAACIRFWVSRLLDFHFPQSGAMTFVKNPNAFRDLLISLK